MEFKFRNVNDAFRTLVTGFYDGSIPTRRSPSRVGEVLMVEEPVLVTYTHPRERVLFNRARDCNPFFHLFESLWMLAGRNDVAPLAYYNPRMAEYSDDGKTLFGAYGYRWKNRFGWDQLLGVVQELKDNPKSRRCVLSIWNSCFHDDNTPGREGDMEMVLNGLALDVPCNTHAYFSIYKEDAGYPEDDVGVPAQQWFLDMTVCNRSNDLIWGMLGANVVHFSILQEYLAACIGVEVGVYRQFSNNLHVYTERWEPEKWLADAPAIYPREHTDLVRDPEQFDNECRQFIDCIDGDFEEPFFKYVAQPMMAAFRAHKRRKYRDDGNALDLINAVQADDWRIVGTSWLEQRKQRWEDTSHAPACAE